MLCAETGKCGLLILSFQGISILAMLSAGKGYVWAANFRAHELRRGGGFVIIM